MRIKLNNVAQCLTYHKPSKILTIINVEALKVFKVCLI